MSRYLRVLCFPIASAKIGKSFPPRVLLCKYKPSILRFLSRNSFSSLHETDVIEFLEISSSLRFVVPRFKTNPERILSVIEHYERFKEVRVLLAFTFFAMVEMNCSEQTFLEKEQDCRFFMFSIALISLQSVFSSMPTALRPNSVILLLPSSIRF